MPPNIEKHTPLKRTFDYAPYFQNLDKAHESGKAQEEFAKALFLQWASGKADKTEAK